jgi:hypothetical protein
MTFGAKHAVPLNLPFVPHAFFIYAAAVKSDTFGFCGLGDLPGSKVNSSASAVAADGRLIFENVATASPDPDSRSGKSLR